MGFLKIYQGSLAPPLLLLLLLATPVCLAQQHFSEAAQESQVSEAKFPMSEKELEQALREVLSQYNYNPLPGLPPININGDQASISLSLADIYLEGLNDVKIKPTINLLKRRVTLHVVFKKISLLVGSYTSSGHILNLPFNGEGPMYLHLHELIVDFSFGWAGKPFPSVCATANSTTYDLDLKRMEIHFENLNEGTDLGQLVDIILPSFGQDIVEKIQVLFSTTYYEFLDSALVDLINNFLECSNKSVEDILKADELIMVMNAVVRDLIP